MSNVRQRGFTLIELLVVLAIIGVLASFIMSNFIGIRQRARDSQRKSDVRQIQAALEIYRADQGSYPSAVPNSTNGSCSRSFLSDSSNCNSTVYMKNVPTDPLNTGQYVYTYISSGGTTYTIYLCLENVNDSQKDTTNNSAYCNDTSNRWSYTLQNP